MYSKWLFIDLYFKINVYSRQRNDIFDTKTKHGYYPATRIIESSTCQSSGNIARHQIRLAYNLSDNLNLENIIKKGPRVKFESCAPDETYIEYKCTHCNGRLYKAGKCVVQIGVQSDLPRFGLVSAIFVRQDAVIFACNIILTVGFDLHYHSYIVEIPQHPLGNQAQNYQYINMNDLSDSTPLHMRKVLNKFYITVPYTV